MLENNSNDNMSEELRYLRSEFGKTIEYIKNRMLLFLYYALSLQAGIIAYHKLIDDKNKYYIDNYFLILISFLVAFGAMYFIMMYHRDYKYNLYRCDFYVDPAFSNIAKASLDVPYFERSTVDLIIKDYFAFFKNEPFLKLYSLFNWGLCFLVIMYLIFPLCICISKLQSELGGIIQCQFGSEVVKLVILFVVAILVFGVSTIFISCKLNINTKKILTKHQAYLSILKSYPGITRAEIEEKIIELSSPAQRLKEIEHEERIYKILLEKLENEKQECIKKLRQ